MCPKAGGLHFPHLQHVLPGKPHNTYTRAHLLQINSLSYHAVLKGRMDQLLAGYASDSSADNNDGSESQIDGANLSKEINVSSSKRKVEGERRLNADPKRPRAEAQSPAADQER